MNALERNEARQRIAADTVFIPMQDLQQNGANSAHSRDKLSLSSQQPLCIDDLCNNYREAIIPRIEGINASGLLSWLFVKLPEYEQKNTNINSVTSVFQFMESTKTEKILKLYSILTELRRKTPTWIVLETIVNFAELIERRYEKYQEDTKINKVDTIRDRINFFVSDCVEALLDKNYDVLKAIEDDLKSTEKSGSQSETKPLWCRVSVKLYPDCIAVGPLGERPLHICALHAARLRGGKGDKDRNIAAGIVRGMINFLKRNKDELFVPYGKHYTAALGCCIARMAAKKKEADQSFPVQKLPFFDLVRRWHDKRVHSCAHEGHKPSFHVWSTVCCGSYEGESLLFFFIASKDEEAIKLLLSLDAEAEHPPQPYRRLMDQEAYGPFFRPVYDDWLTSFHVIKGWQWYQHYRSHGRNPYASSLKSYFGFDPLSFAASQGDVKIFMLLFHRSMEIWTERSKALCDRQDRIGHGDFDAFVSRALWRKPDTCLGSAVWSHSVGKLGSDAEQEAFVRTLVVNRRDEFGNTMLHLAAWNDKPDMYDHLVRLGADPSAVNHSGLTPYTQAVRFGVWPMTKHIWKNHFTSVYWTFGSVQAESVEYADFDAAHNGPGSFVSVSEIDLCLDALKAHYIKKSPALQRPCQPPNLTRSFPGLESMQEEVKEMLQPWSKTLLQRFLVDEFRNAEGKYAEKKSSCSGKQQQQEHETSCSQKHATQSDFSGWRRCLLPETQELWLTRVGREDEPIPSKIPLHVGQVKSAVRLLTTFRPPGWYEHFRELMEEVVMSKWSRGYYLVHIGDSVLPYCVLILLFGLMWLDRRLSILEHRFWWAVETVAAPDPAQGVEGACGWRSIRDSRSGAIQAVLTTYGGLSLLRLAAVQSRLRPTDLDEDVNWRITTHELVNCVYQNLESAMHVVMSGLFVTIGVARVAAGEGCDVGYVRTEKNATSIAALILFFNLFIICKPFKGFGLLVLTWYRFLLADLFNFLVMYSIVFVAFLMAVQTLHNGNHTYLMWMDQTDAIVPQVEASIRTQYPLASPADNLTYLVNSNAPATNQLLATATALDGCHDFRRTITDTAFSLLEISFGDGLADALQQARSKPYHCAGFAPDYLVGYLLILWAFLTNTLIMNMLIAMMNHTFDHQRDNLNMIWLLDVSKRIIRYESSFPELAHRIARPEHIYSVFKTKYLASRLEDLGLIFYCVPEIHFVANMLNGCLSSRNRRLGVVSMQEPEPKEGSWAHSLRILKEHEARCQRKTGTCSVLYQVIATMNPLVSLMPAMSSSSEKAVAFGIQAEASATERPCPGTAPVNEQERPDGRLVALIYRLEQLKEVLGNRKLNTHHVKREEADASPSAAPRATSAQNGQAGSQPVQGGLPSATQVGAKMGPAVLCGQA